MRTNKGLSALTRLEPVTSGKPLTPDIRILFVDAEIDVLERGRCFDAQAASHREAGSAVWVSTTFRSPSSMASSTIVPLTRPR